MDSKHGLQGLQRRDSTVQSIESPLTERRLRISSQYWQLYKGIQAAYDDAQQTMACKMLDASALEGVQAFIVKRAPNG